MFDKSSTLSQIQPKQVEQFMQKLERGKFIHFMRGSRDSRDLKISRLLENLHSEDEWSSEVIHLLGPQIVRGDPVRSSFVVLKC